MKHQRWSACITPLFLVSKIQKKLNLFLLSVILMAFSATSQAADDKQINHVVKQLNQILNASSIENQIPSLPSDLAAAIQNIEQTTDSEEEFIIGGNNASRGEYREFALILFVDAAFNITSFCGGSVIASNKILTAGHCSQEPASRTLVLPGFYSFNDRLTAASIYEVTRVRDHPQYRNISSGYDVGIMTLARTYSGFRASVHRGSDKFVGDTGTVIGVGLTSTSTPALPDVLQEVAAPIVSNSACNDSWDSLIGIRPINSTMMCAGFRNNGRGSCSGDSGSALFANIDNQRVIVGTVSFGLNICEAQRASQAYARMSAVADFIASESPATKFVTGNSTNIAPVIGLLLSEDVPSIDPSALFPVIEQFNEGKFVIKLKSDSGDVIGEGQSYSYNPRNSNVYISVKNNRSLNITIKGVSGNKRNYEPETWRWTMETAPDTTLTSSTTYVNATRYPSNTGNGLNFEGNSGHCYANGEFRIFEIEYTEGAVSKLIADFTQYCGSSTRKLRGSIHYDNSKEPMVILPTELTDTSPFPALPELEYSGTVIKIESEPGEYIGEGNNYLFDDSNSNISIGKYLSYPEVGIHIVTQTENNLWNLIMLRGSLDADPDKGKLLSRGLYDIAFRDFRNRPAAGLTYARQSRRCATSRGSFRIFDVSYDGEGNLEKITADFVQRCGSNRTVTLRGSIRHDSTLPVRP